MLALPARTPVKVVLYVPGVDVAETVPKVPVLPPERLNAKSLFVKPVMAFPAASSTTIVTVSGLPDATEELAKLTLELPPLTPPGITVMVGCAVRVTSSMVVVRVLAVPAVVPLNATV